LNPGPVDSYGNSFAAVAISTYGHEAQLAHEWVNVAAGYGAELKSARARLRCTVCGARMPRVEVYRVGS
jgi:hypothetical protein